MDKTTTQECVLEVLRPVTSHTTAEPAGGEKGGFDGLGREGWQELAHRI